MPTGAPTQFSMVRKRVTIENYAQGHATAAAPFSILESQIPSNAAQGRGQSRSWHFPEITMDSRQDRQQRISGTAMDHSPNTERNVDASKHTICTGIRRTHRPVHRRRSPFANRGRADAPDRCIHPRRAVSQEAPRRENADECAASARC